MVHPDAPKEIHPELNQNLKKRTNGKVSAVASTEIPTFLGFRPIGGKRLLTHEKESLMFRVVNHHACSTNPGPLLFRFLEPLEASPRGYVPKIQGLSSTWT